jgi:hypothetical protein
MNYTKNRQCRCCKDIFTPDFRNVRKQEYCGKPECRKASKSASQKRWSKKNTNYFKGPIHVDRVREWRLANPGRSRRKTSAAVLQDDCSQIPFEKQEDIPHFPPESPMPTPVLQDFFLPQHPVFIGLIAHLTGCVLQEEFAEITRRLEQLGHDVINTNPGGRYDPQVSNLSRSHPHHCRTVQLGGSPSGS